jgi:hypothetical protein
LLFPNTSHVGSFNFLSSSLTLLSLPFFINKEFKTLNLKNLNLDNSYHLCSQAQSKQKKIEKNTKLVMETLIHIWIKVEPFVMHATLVGKALWPFCIVILLNFHSCPIIFGYFNIILF